MINNASEIFTRTTTALKEADSQVQTSSVYKNAPSSYPFVSIEMIGNDVYERGRDSKGIENFAVITYELNVICNGNTRMSRAWKLLEVADNLLKSIGFVRVQSRPIQDQNETLYRIVARYEGVVSSDLKVYGR